MMMQLLKETANIHGIKVGKVDKLDRVGKGGKLDQDNIAEKLSISVNMKIVLRFV